jgi:hypothetical protein
VAQSLSETRTAFFMLYNEHGCWPRENNTDCNGTATANPSVASLIASGTFGLGKYISAPPAWPFSTAQWYYDNDADAQAAPCPVTASAANAGVNIFIGGVTEAQYEALDKIIDHDADPTTNTAKYCGALRYNGSLLYSISATQ